MRFKSRALAALVVVALCLFGSGTSMPLFAVSSVAETTAPELEIKLAADPDEFIDSGEAQLNFELTNRSNATLESVILTSSDGLNTESVGEIAPGATLTHSRVHTVTDAELASGSIEYTITCSADSLSYEYPAAASIQKLPSEPQVEFLRHISSRSAIDGNSITIVYKVCNTGYVPISNVAVTDPLGEFSAQLDILEAGADKVFLQYIQPGQDTVSAPVLTYTAETASNVYTTALDALPLQPAQGMLDASITAARSIFTSDTAEVVLQLINTGNLDYTDITVFDDMYGGIIADSIEVPAGSEPVEVERTYPIREDSAYRWRITGRTSSGDQIDFVTNTANLDLDAKEGDALLSVQATTSMPKISKSGYVPVRIELSNIGSAMASNVLLREETTGKICRLAVVPTGDPTVHELRHKVTQNTTLVFSAVYSDRFGQERVATSQPLEITIGPGGQSPETDHSGYSLFGGIATQMHNTPLFVVLLVAACLILASLIAVLIISTRRAYVRRKSQAEAIRQRRREDLAKTAPFKPIRRKQPAKK